MRPIKLVLVAKGEIMNKFVIECLKDMLNLEVSNKVSVTDDEIFIELENGQNAVIKTVNL